jgi:hypothetical protein
MPQNPRWGIRLVAVSGRIYRRGRGIETMDGVGYRYLVHILGPLQTALELLGILRRGANVAQPDEGDQAKIWGDLTLKRCSSEAALGARGYCGIRIQIQCHRQHPTGRKGSGSSEMRETARRRV